MNALRTTAAAAATGLLLAACSGSTQSPSNTASSDTVPAVTAALDPAPTAVTGDSVTDATAGSADVTTSSDSAQSPPVDKDIITRSDDAIGDGVFPEGFTTVTALVSAADGEVCEVCLWLADDPDESGRGLMGVTDLGVPVGMAFVYDTPRDGAFFMFNTPTPLSIAWFSPSGDHVAQADMDPCVVEDSSVCERYRPGATYTVAIEMFDGQLGKVGIGPGSRIELLDLSCD